MEVVVSENGISIKQDLRPFVAREAIICPGCGMAFTSRWRRLLRKLRGKRTEFMAKPSFCPGSKPPTEELGGLSMMFLYGGMREITNKCSGIERPHLHWHCETCRAEWMTETAFAGGQK